MIMTLFLSCRDKSENSSPSKTPTLFEDRSEEYLKDGKLREKIEVISSRGGADGVTGTYYIIEPDGSWISGSLLPPIGEKGDPEYRGKLTEEQITHLAKYLAFYNLDTLPDIGKTEVNPKEIKISFGKKVSRLISGKLSEKDRKIYDRYDGILETVQSICNNN